MEYFPVNAKIDAKFENNHTISRNYGCGIIVVLCASADPARSAMVK